MFKLNSRRLIILSLLLLNSFIVAVPDRPFYKNPIFRTCVFEAKIILIATLGTVSCFLISHLDAFLNAFSPYIAQSDAADPNMIPCANNLHELT